MVNCRNTEPLLYDTEDITNNRDVTDSGTKNYLKQEHLQEPLIIVM